MKPKFACPTTTSTKVRIATRHEADINSHLRSVFCVPSTTTSAKVPASARLAPLMWFSRALTSTLKRSWGADRSPTCAEEARG